MNDLGETGLNLLLFSVGEVHFGIDSEQVAGINAFQGEDAGDLFWFHNEMGFGDATVTYLLPTVVTIRCPDEQPYRVIIDLMEDIREIATDSILPFPPLLEPFALRKGMWGVLLVEGKMVLLVDFMRILREKTAVSARHGGDE
ncbi:MAG: hypothetical protein A2X82_00885 [Geobacteraceae bacterium GWC2_55_20]|nr:MAG: hypothetical protein A2X82_00885 [Geobacteraceae bacterium GWC2_55_20]OGU24668.1 MAG: hypothetical protein A2X85_03215 [Geobacteraceae bacterium GWF2_54_21]HBA70925.1 hypothetical protein [Geobacter sp.]HCE68475.1 hypothetical protein [Geobacter sp.]